MLIIVLSRWKHLAWILCLYPQQCKSPAEGTIYRYSAKTLNGSHTVKFCDYEGQTVLFVNTATYWGLTHQYVGKRRCQMWFFFMMQCQQQTASVDIQLASSAVRTECTTRGAEPSPLHHPRLPLQPVWETGTGNQRWNPAWYKVRNDLLAIRSEAATHCMKALKTSSKLKAV